MPPLGLGWITSFLQSRGISATLIDLQASDENIESLLKIHKPRIVGIGGTTHTRMESFSLARQVKLYDSAIGVLYGGSHATFTAGNTLWNIPDIDIIVRGEGEVTTHRVVESVLKGTETLGDIPGISFRRNGVTVHNRPAERIPNLDALPFPYRIPEARKKYNLLLDFLHVPAAAVISSRGCPVNCSFCSASAMFGNQMTFRSAHNVLDEIEILLKEHSYEGIKFFDSTLTLNKNHIESLCAEIQRRKLRFPWECEIRVTGMTYDLLRTMRDAGCYYVDFGVETVSSSVLEQMHKGITLEQVNNVFRWTKQLGLYTKVFFTFGHIGETFVDARRTVEFMERHADAITLPATGVGIRMYPGTQVERFVLMNGYVNTDFSWSQPYFDQRLESLGNDPTVPILLQPQFGWNEFRRIEKRLIWFWLKNPWKAIRVIWSQIRLGRGFVLLRLLYRFVEMYIHPIKP